MFTSTLTGVHIGYLCVKWLLLYKVRKLPLMIRNRMDYKQVMWMLLLMLDERTHPATKQIKEIDTARISAALKQVISIIDFFEKILFVLDDFSNEFRVKLPWIGNPSF